MSEIDKKMAELLEQPAVVTCKYFQDKNCHDRYDIKCEGFHVKSDCNWCDNWQEPKHYTYSANLNLAVEAAKKILQVTAIRFLYGRHSDDNVYCLIESGNMHTSPFLGRSEAEALCNAIIAAKCLKKGSK